MPGASCTRSLVRKKVAHELATTGTPNDPAFPARRFDGLFRALPGDRALLPPSPAGCSSRRLDASVGASGPHGFAVRFNALRLARLGVHRVPHQHL